jgi:hypothetical protein
VAERGEESIIAFSSFGAGGGLSRLRQNGRACQPEADEHRHRFDRNTEIALQPPHTAVELVESPSDDGLCRSAASGERKEAMAASAIKERDCSRRAA